MSRPDKCPICKRKFKSDDCPHSLTQVEAFIAERALEEKIRKVVRSELKMMGVIT